MEISLVRPNSQLQQHKTVNTIGFPLVPELLGFITLSATQQYMYQHEPNSISSNSIVYWLINTLCKPVPLNGVALFKH